MLTCTGTNGPVGSATGLTATWNADDRRRFAGYLQRLTDELQR
ncbi:hypothetical protein ACFQZZ_26700 [Nocardia sp. GCM10030253]